MKRCMAKRSFERLDEGVCWEPSARKRHQDAFMQVLRWSLRRNLIGIPGDDNDSLERKGPERVEGSGMVYALFFPKV
jgi:hypothetical protein